MFCRSQRIFTNVIFVCSALMILPASAFKFSNLSLDSRLMNTAAIEQGECHSLFESIEVTKSEISRRSSILAQQLASLEALESEIAPVEQYIANKQEKQNYSKGEAKEYNQQLRQLQKLVAEYNGLVSVYDATWQQHSVQISNTNVAITHYSNQCKQDKASSSYVFSESTGS